MRRRSLAWLCALPLMLAGSQLAHALDYRLLIPNSHLRLQVLAATGHSYLDYLPLLLAVGFSCEVVWLLLLTARSRRSPRTRAPLAAWPFALLPLLTFAVQEHLERWLHTGVFPWNAVLGATFLPGLLLQLPFALLAYLAARLLIGLAEELAAWLEGSIELPRRNTPVSRPRPGRLVPRPLLVGSGRTVRGPPLPVS